MTTRYNLRNLLMYNEPVSVRYNPCARYERSALCSLSWQLMPSSKTYRRFAPLHGHPSWVCSRVIKLILGQVEARTLNLRGWRMAWRFEWLVKNEWVAAPVNRIVLAEKTPKCSLQVGCSPTQVYRHLVCHSNCYVLDPPRKVNKFSHVQELS